MDPTDPHLSATHNEVQPEIPDFLTLQEISFARDAGGFHLGPFSAGIARGEIVAVVGPSGSGKTTLLRVLSGLEKPENGCITLDGQTLSSPAVFVRPEKRSMGMVFQEHALFPHLTVRSNILFGLAGRPRPEQEERLRELEVLLGLEGCLPRYPQELSGGQQQRVALARSLAPNPKVILLDEPLSNIDADLRASLGQELRQVLKATGATVVWVTHDQSEALSLADRVMVMNRGNIEQFDTPRNLYNHPLTRFVADFIGHATFIRGTVEGGRLRTEAGSLPAPPGLQPAERVEVMVRPDDVHVTASSNGSGIVVSRQFLGAVQLVTLALPSGHLVLCYQPPYIHWEEGSRVEITLRIRNVIAFPV